MTSSESGASSVSESSKRRARSLVTLAVVAIASSFVAFMSYVFVISALPRPMQGESVMIPWPVCLAGCLALTTLLPWLISLPFLRHRGLRLCFLVFLLTAVLVWYFAFGFDGLLDKAYRRGL
jgi:hypothetical protein